MYATREDHSTDGASDWMLHLGQMQCRRRVVRKMNQQHKTNQKKKILDEMRERKGAVNALNQKAHLCCAPY